MPFSGVPTLTVSRVMVITLPESASACFSAIFPNLAQRLSLPASEITLLPEPQPQPSPQFHDENGEGVAVELVVSVVDLDSGAATTLLRLASLLCGVRHHTWTDRLTGR